MWSGLEVVKMLRTLHPIPSDGSKLKVCAYTLKNNEEIFGINSKAHLAEATKMLERCFSSKDKKKRIEGYLLCDEEFKLSSNIKFLDKKEQNSKVLFEDVYESTKLTENEMKNMFVDVCI